MCSEVKNLIKYNVFTLVSIVLPKTFLKTRRGFKTTYTWPAIGRHKRLHENAAWRHTWGIDI